MARAGEHEEIAALEARGETLFRSPASCWLCHGENGEGRVGPSIQYGPTPFDIHDQFNSNPQMAPLRQALNPTDEDLLALSVYIRRMVGKSAADIDVHGLRATLNSVQDYEAVPDYFLTDRDKTVQQIEAFESVLSDWERRAKTGSIKHSYEVREVREFDPGKPRFSPQPGGIYFYENLGTSGRIRPEGTSPPKSAQIVVGDAAGKKVIASYELPPELRGSVHTTVMSPDGKYVYIIGARPFSRAETEFSLTTPQSLLKVDAVTLQPVRQLMIGARLHHGQIFQDRYLLLDSFARDNDGLDIMLFDPQTDQIIGGVRSDDLGGSPYTAWTDNEFIYILMEPLGYGTALGDKTWSGYIGAGNLSRGQLTTLRPFWIAKLDPRSWEIVREYPYPGYRGDWITFDSGREHLYVTAGASANVTKIIIETGQIAWTAPTGTGPYGASLNADEAEIWVADKGETTGMFGRTISVLEASSGHQLHTLFSGYQVDHILLAPNGNEFWATSNAEGRIYVFDAGLHEQTHVIDMPQFGDPHGLVWVHYDADGQSRVVRDQGGFHGGVDPRAGRSLRY
jgi:DNA-binding beta-propeller fold protein YncE